MAHHHESAGNSAASGNAATSGTSSLVQARDTRSAGAFPLAELVVIIRPHGCDFWAYEGTRAQLEAEGVIPPGLDWPEGARPRTWEDARFAFSLRRVRPEGLRGPQRLWINGDWWRLRCDDKQAMSYPERALHEKAQALAEEIHRQSREGRRFHHLQWQAYLRAQEDQVFQAVKSIFVPKRKKPGPKSRIAAEGKDHA